MSVNGHVSPWIIPVVACPWLTQPLAQCELGLATLHRSTGTENGWIEFECPVYFRNKSWVLMLLYLIQSRFLFSSHDYSTFEKHTNTHTALSRYVCIEVNVFIQTYRLYEIFLFTFLLICCSYYIFLHTFVLFVTFFHVFPCQHRWAFMPCQ